MGDSLSYLDNLLPWPNDQYTVGRKMAAAHFTTVPCESLQGTERAKFFQYFSYTKAWASVGVVKSADRFVGFHGALFLPSSQRGER